MKIVAPLAASLADPILARWMPFIVTASDVLVPTECDALVARIEALGPELAAANRGA